MDVSQLEPELLKHLRVQFGRHGDRAVEFLDTARRLLSPGSIEVPRLGELAAYCIREALKEIPKASGVSPDREWARLSREAVITFGKYEEAAESVGADRQQALAEHRAAIEDLQEFHDHGQGIHETRLVALMIKRAGVEPLKSGTAPVADYQKLIANADRAAHSQCSIAAARKI